MNSLQGVLARIPGLAGYAAGSEESQMQQMGQLRQMGALQQIVSHIEKQKMARQAMQNDLAFRAELQALGPNPDQESLARVAAKYAPASDIMKSQTASVDRRAQMEASRAAAQERTEAQREAQRERIQAQIDIAKQRSEDQALSRAEQNKARIDMMRLAASLRPAPQVQPLVPIVDPATGKQKLVERKDAVGQMPAATGAKAETVAAGKADVDKDILTLKTSLDALHEGGGITSTEKGVLPNLGRWASTTGPGQLLGRMGGTVNQKHRDVISQSRPLLMRSIMQATGMSARSIDSNAELKLWLSTATDPEKGYEANIEALNNIAAKYGSGGFLENNQSTAGKITPTRRATDVPNGIDPKVWSVMTPEEKALFK